MPAAPMTPDKVLEIIRHLLGLQGSAQLKLRLSFRVLESYFAGRPIDMGPLQAESDSGS
jgi:hypothetical protein